MGRHIRKQRSPFRKRAGPAGARGAVVQGRRPPWSAFASERFHDISRQTKCRTISGGHLKV